MQKIGLYLRVSTSEQSKLVEGSLVSQRQRLDSYVAYRNSTDPCWGKVIGTYVDEALSGGHMERPMLIKLIRKIRRGEIDTIIVADLSRLSRSIQDFSSLWSVMKTHGTKLISLREQFDTNSAAGEMILFALINFAQFERKQTAERVVANLRARAERGLFNGGPTPFGFEADPHRRGHLVINPAEAENVRSIFYFFRSTGTLRATLEKVRAAGMHPKDRGNSHCKSQREFTLEGIWRILRNPAYIGRREINKRYRFKTQSALAESQKYKTTNAVWPGIVSEEEFERVQQELDANRFRLRPTPDGQFDYIYSSLVFCSECGKSMIGVGGTSSNGKKYRYYGHKEKGVRCKIKRIDALKLHRLMRKYLHAVEKICGSKFSYIEPIMRKRIMRTAIKRIEVFKNRLQIKQNFEWSKELNFMRIQHDLSICNKKDFLCRSDTVENGRESEKALQSAQLIDYVNISFCEIGENSRKLRVLRAEKQLSMRELSKSTGHSRSYLRQQLRKFGIISEKDSPRLAPFGWDWKGNELVQNAKEYPILCEIIALNKSGKGCKLIAAELNRKGVPSKTGGRWWFSSVQNILNRELNKQLKESL